MADNNIPHLNYHSFTLTNNKPATTICYGHERCVMCKLGAIPGHIYDFGNQPGYVIDEVKRAFCPKEDEEEVIEVPEKKVPEPEKEKPKTPPTTPPREDREKEKVTERTTWDPENPTPKNWRSNPYPLAEETPLKKWEPFKSPKPASPPRKINGKTPPLPPDRPERRGTDQTNCMGYASRELYCKGADFPDMCNNCGQYVSRDSAKYHPCSHMKGAWSVPSNITRRKP